MKKSKGHLQRRKLFDLYAQNLNNMCELGNYRLTYPAENGNPERIITEPIIFCPLCMKAYGEDALGEDGIDRLTVEHVPPKSVGGKGKILTCKLCNDKLGEVVDHYLEKQLTIEPFAKGLDNSSIKGKVKFQGVSAPIHATFRYEKGTFVIHPILHNKNKVEYYKAVEALKHYKDGSQFNISAANGSYLKYHMGLLKSAYLEMFFLFGHVFLFSKNTQIIRDQINNREKWILPHSSVLDMEFDHQHVGVNILYEPKDKISYLVILNLKSRDIGYSKRVGVLIPGPGRSGWEAYENYKTTGNFTCKLTNLSNANCIREKELTLFYNDIWRDVVNGKWMQQEDV